MGNANLGLVVSRFRRLRGEVYGSLENRTTLESFGPMATKTERKI